MRLFLLFLLLFFLIACGVQPHNYKPLMVTDLGKYSLAIELDSSFAEAGSLFAEADNPITKKKNEVTAGDSRAQKFDQLIADLKRLTKEKEELRIKSLDLMQNNPRADNYSSEMTKKMETIE